LVGGNRLASRGPDLQDGRMNTTTTNILRVSDIHKSFDGLPLLQGVSFEIRAGQRLAVLGPGGCGKSTLLKVILGIVPADSGEVEVLGKNLALLDRPDRLRLLRQVGMAFQQGALFDFMTVRENILFAMENMTSFSRLDMEDRVNRMLAAVYLPAAGRKIPSELSGGMRRRVGIVRALVTEPKLALLDEPTAGLDPVTSTVVIDMIHRLGAQTQSALLCVTSSVEVAFTFSNRVAILKDGVIAGEGTWEELHALGNPWISKFLDLREFTPPASVATEA
jgi:phospholipid/cholesterol/gamma-HCH transport system ATP-binding protein